MFLPHDKADTMYLCLMKAYYVYILSNLHKTVLYIGVTNNLRKRMEQHISNSVAHKSSFAGKYNCTHLLYFEEFRDVRQAINREKELKGWIREKKLQLIRTVNPEMTFIEL